MENHQLLGSDMHVAEVMGERSDDLPRSGEAQNRLLLHHLNNALMIIGSNCELLLGSLALDDLRFKQAQRIQNATRQAILMVDDLSLSPPKSGSRDVR
jgi:hypothetical protein